MTGINLKTTRHTFYFIFFIISFNSCVEYASEFASIPGFTVDQATQDLKVKGFKIRGQEGNLWIFEHKPGDNAFVIEIFGTSPKEIKSVTGTISGPVNSEEKINFFSEVASLPYRGANPQIAKEWASKHEANGGDTTIGKARFRLVSSQLDKHITITGSLD